jgi:hypothetical protein
MVALGAVNSRMRDFFDVHALAAGESFDGATLVRAVRATFERRRTEVPRELALALTRAFADLEGKRAQWSAFLAKNRIAGAPGLGRRDRRHCAIRAPGDTGSEPEYGVVSPMGARRILAMSADLSAGRRSGTRLQARPFVGAFRWPA